MRSDISWHVYVGMTATTRDTSTGHERGTVVEPSRVLTFVLTIFVVFTAWDTECYAAAYVAVAYARLFPGGLTPDMF